VRRQSRDVSGSKWRIWPGDLATTLGWTPEAEIEALPIQNEFACMLSSTNPTAPGYVRLTRATISLMKNCAKLEASLMIA
jgi:hypothetical protein